MSQKPVGQSVVANASNTIFMQNGNFISGDKKAV
jgi:hypothetical protein